MPSSPEILLARRNDSWLFAELLCPKCFHGIDGCGAVRGKQCGNHGDDREEQRGCQAGPADLQWKSRP